MISDEKCRNDKYYINVLHKVKTHIPTGEKYSNSVKCHLSIVDCIEYQLM